MRTAALVATIALAVFAAQAAAFPKKPSCACALRGGDDACGCNRVLVRPPRPIKIDPQGPRVVCHRFPGVDPLHPIGDVCSCGHKFEHQWKPKCKHQKWLYSSPSLKKRCPKKKLRSKHQKVYCCREQYPQPEPTYYGWYNNNHFSSCHVHDEDLCPYVKDYHYY